MSSVDWRTISSAVLGSSVAMAAIGYLVKTAIERSLDVRIEKMREQNKAELQEQFRRQALVWNSQYEVAKTLLSLIYRFRNSFRELAPLLADESPEARRTQSEIFERLRTYGKGIVEILYEDRAILPPALFAAAHDLRSPVSALTDLGRRHLSESGRRRLAAEETARAVTVLYQRIDAVYTLVVTIVHEMIGIDQADGLSH